MRRVAGIDVGGTFTDLILAEQDGAGVAVRIAKVPTSAANQALGVVGAISAAGASPGDLDLIIHGTTATTNAVLERKVAKVGLITTEGFRDVLELGRRTRPRAYGMTGVFEPLIERPYRREVPERLNAGGEVVTPLDEAAVRREELGQGKKLLWGQPALTGHVVGGELGEKQQQIWLINQCTGQCDLTQPATG